MDVIVCPDDNGQFLAGEPLALKPPGQLFAYDV
jgi:hypothetical protein